MEQTRIFPLVQPGYDRRDLHTRILHLGFGAFARAHPLLYTDLANAASGGDWGVAVARLNTGAALLGALDAADHLYTVGELDDLGLTPRQICCVTRSLHPARDGIGAIPELIADPELQIIALTITEKGYCLSAGELDLSHPQIQHDLADPQRPTSAIGVIAEGLRRRRAAGQGGVTILSCDNLPSNGVACRAALLGMARAQDPALGAWIAATCRFPATMVDRIVPALSADASALLRDALGRVDPNGILCEPFRQWVIEDDFASERPDWGAAGAEMVPDVTPFEEMKLRMLNGAHSCLAYLGALHGHATISDCMGDAVFRRAVRHLMLAEMAPTLSVPIGVDLEEYADRLIARFGNSKLHHRTIQIAMDGSQKLPQRLLAPIAANLARGAGWPLAALGVAGWMRFLRGRDEAGEALPVQDPLAEQFSDLSKQADGPEYVAALLALEQVFDATLAQNPQFRTTVLEAYERLSTVGARASLAQALEA